MIFSSLEFFVLLALVLAALAVTGREEIRRNVLLAASYVFYGWWDWRFCFLMLVTTTIDYLVGLRLEKTAAPRARRRLLVASIIANLGILVAFKYTNFFLDSFRPLGGALGWEIPHPEIILPAGISFFTFQSMSYTIDVYRKVIPATTNFRDFALFVAFFPQLVAGPIVRGKEFLPQLAFIHPLRFDNIRTGTEIFLRGFVKKVLFADTLAVYADPIFADPGAYSPLTCWLGVIAYAGQIYYDFAGYSEMAIGAGRMLGFELPVNFRHPYLSRSITEFWRRWHISLSTWLRDYLYIPLGGNRFGRGRTYVNLLLTMLLGGLWHGAAWTFVVWGAMHGAALAGHKLLMERRGERAREQGTGGAILSWAGTFLFVLVTWVFFRARTFETAWIYLRKMAFLDGGGADWYYVNAILAIVAGTLLHLWIKVREERDLILDLRRPLAWSGFAAAVLAVLLFAPFEANPFIYFQF